MHPLYFFLVSVLTWHGCCWHHLQHVAADPLPSAPASMTLNSTLNIPITPLNALQTQVHVQTVMFSSSTYRAFYFTFEEQSRVVEVSLPPTSSSGGGGEDMFHVAETNITWKDGNPVQFISHALHVPSTTTYDPASSDSSTVYLCSSGPPILLLKYNMTTPPSEGGAPPQPSTFELQAYLELPNTLLGVETFMLVDDNLYLSGLEYSNSTSAYIMRIPLSNFTRLYIAEDSPIRIAGAPQLTAAATDGTYIYYGANSNLVYRLHLAEFAVNGSALQLTMGGVNANFAGAFADPERHFVYFFNSDSSSSTLVRVDTLSFTQPQPPLVFPPNLMAAEVVVHDTYGGQVYFGHDSDPGVVSNINLDTFSVRLVLTLQSPLSFLATALVDVEHSWAYFTTLSNLTILKVQLPLACAGLDNTTASDSIGINNCSYPNGYCQYATCHCFPELNYEGPACASKKCLHDCYRDAANSTDGESHGACYNGTCDCYPNYNGTDCGTRRCKNNCLGRGSCTGEPSYKCICDEFYHGDDCSEYSDIPQCNKLHSCHDCATNTSCGWCISNNKCMEGDFFGPLAQLCERYSYRECPSSFFFVFAYILTVVCWLFVLASAVMTMIQDFTLPENTKTKRFVLRFWYRNQFAAKTWQMVEYIQMLAITGYLAVDMPALYSEFILPFQWSILHLPYPFSHPQSIRPPFSSAPSPPSPSRELLTFFEEGRVVHSEARELFLGNLFFYSLIVVAPLVLFAIPVFLVASCKPDFSEKEKLMNISKSRVVYCFVRLHQFVYSPLVVTSLFTLTWYSSAPSPRPASFKAAVVLSVFTLIGIGLAFPIGTLLRIYNLDKELFSVSFSQKYGSLYQQYHFRKAFFNSVRIAKLLAIALFIALLYRHPVPQLILIALTHVVYFIVLLLTRPHADHIHYFTDLVVTALSAVLFLLLLGFRNRNHNDSDIDNDHDTTTAPRYALGAVVVHILALCVIVVGIFSTVFKMNGIFGVTDLKHTVANRNSTSEAITGLQKEHRVSSSSTLSTSM